MYNKVTLVGALGKEPEIREVNGKQLANLFVSTWHSRKVGDEWVTDTTWHNVNVWDKNVISIQKCVKGDYVLVEGEIRNQEWKDKNGDTVRRTVIVGTAKHIRPKPQYNNGYQSYAPQQQQQTQQQQRVDATSMQDDNADLPF